MSARKRFFNKYLKINAENKTCYFCFVFCSWVLFLVDFMFFEGYVVLDFSWVGFFRLYSFLALHLGPFQPDTLEDYGQIIHFLKG